jgi:hypothetical protein
MDGQLLLGHTKIESTEATYAAQQIRLALFHDAKRCKAAGASLP